jgi:hypothetical protein
MVTHRRKTVIALAFGALLLTSGCLGFILGNEPLTATASPVSVSDDALSDTGYSEERNETLEVNETRSIGGQERTVSVTNYLHSYSRSVDLAPEGAEEVELTTETEQDFARVAFLSSPAVEIAGNTLNPIGQWSRTRLIDEMFSSYGGVDDVTFEENRTVDMVDDSRTVGRYTGTATYEGRETDVMIHVTRFRHGSDFVVAIAVHPTQIEEESNVDAMFEGLEHEG